jgi:hypothetical protein
MQIGLFQMDFFLDKTFLRDKDESADRHNGLQATGSFGSIVCMSGDVLCRGNRT